MKIFEEFDIRESKKYFKSFTNSWCKSFLKDSIIHLRKNIFERTKVIYVRNVKELYTYEKIQWSELIYTNEFLFSEKCQRTLRSRKKAH